MTINNATSHAPITLALVTGAAFQVACVRCAKGLSDPASIEAGVGPECRGKANGLLAKEFRGEFSGDALFSAMMLSASGFPGEAAPLVERVGAAVIRTKAFLANGAGDDCRELVRELTALAAYTAEGSPMREQLFAIMRGLGYAAYASYLAGATPKPVEVTVGCDVSGPYVAIPAPRQSEPRLALTRIVKPHTGWPVPIGALVFLRPGHINALGAWLTRHAPMTRIDLIVAQLATVIAELATKRVAAAQKVCHIKRMGMCLFVSTPERNERAIDLLKSKGARWSADSQQWTVSAIYTEWLAGRLAALGWAVSLDAM